MFIALRFSILMFVLCGLVYPLLLTGLGQLMFPYQANGSLIRNDKNQIVGSLLIGQAFTQPQYFHPRPSAAGKGYDASNSGGSNYGTTNKKLIDRVKADMESYQKFNAVDQIPQDAVTASASGLDPHISVDNARLQAKRVALARKISESQVVVLINTHTEHGVFNPISYVNVLKLNLALDSAAPLSGGAPGEIHGTR